MRCNPRVGFVALVLAVAALVPLRAAYAYCNDPGAPCSLQALAESYGWGSGNGVYNHATQTVNGTLSVSGATTSASVSLNSSTFTVSTPHTVIQTSIVTTSTGAKLLRMYLYTNSSYAPGGESGTFEWDNNGNLVSGDATTLLNMKYAMLDADNDLFDSINSNWSNVVDYSWWQGGLCAAGVFGIGAWTIGWLYPPAIPFTTEQLTPYMGFFGGWVYNDCF